MIDGLDNDMINLCLGIYIYFKSKIKGRAYYGLGDDLLFSCKKIALFLKMKYNQINIEKIRDALDILKTNDLLRYEKVKSSWAPYKVIGLAWNEPGIFLTSEDIKEKYSWRFDHSA